MGLLTNRVERNEIKLGDHIYTYRAVFTYSHHGLSLPLFLSLTHFVVLFSAYLIVYMLFKNYTMWVYGVMRFLGLSFIFSFLFVSICFLGFNCLELE